MNWNRAHSLRVVVTPDDIRNGKPGSAIRCPIALAAKRLFHSEPIISTDGETLIVYLPDLRLHYNGPVSAVKFVEQFDKGFFVEPEILMYRLIHSHYH
jgi:hypothetical protein